MVQEKHCDVVVIGLGGAGASAAITAKELGADVIAIERSTEAGGCTRDSGGSIRQVLDFEDTVAHYVALTEGTTPEAVIRAYVDGARKIPEWVAERGGKLVESKRGRQDGSKAAGVESMPTTAHEYYPAGRPVSAYPAFAHGDSLGTRYKVVPQDWEMATGASPQGVTLWQVLSARLDELEVPVLYSTRARRLIQDPETKAITGVVCDSKEGEVIVHARKGVILTTGGFASDPEMKKDLFGADMPTLCAPGLRTGDGIRMAQDIGASMWHMNAIAARFGYKFPEHDAAFLAKITGPGFVFVDSTAKRYVNEADLDAHATTIVTLVTNPHNGLLDRIPSFIIFDEETRCDGPIASVARGHNAGLPWSGDNSKEVRNGWIKQADTLEELAGVLGLDPAQLVATVEDFNAIARGEKDDHYGRKVSDTRPIASGPFYGVELVPALYNTQGGPRRNERAEILDVFGEPIPGLYSSGELGSMWNRLYPGAGNVTEGIVFGQIAAREAVSR